MNLRKIGIAFLGLFLLMQTSAKAHEGMWLPMFLNSNYEEMKALGFELTPEDIYAANQSSLKDAIVSMGGFCTGEMISPEGLMLTNHHCGYDAIRTQSTPEVNYLKDGFWAMSKAEELPIEGLFVRFVVRMEDVTLEALEGVTADMSEGERAKAIKANTDAITAEAIKDSHYEADVKPFFEGNNFYLMVYERYTDVRLAAAPPESVGKYGGDTDNWMWPRHTGDFSMFRVYASADNEPADYSEENVPFVPRHFLPISMDGVDNGDFTMTFGFPGSTDRFLSSWGVDEAINVSQPAIVEIRDLKLKTMKKYMDADPAVRLQFASQYAQVANYWKYFIGQIKGLKRNNVLAKKQKLEAEFTAWVNKSEERRNKYGGALKMIEESYEETRKTARAEAYLSEAGLQAGSSVIFAFRMGRNLGVAFADDASEEVKTAAVEKARAFSDAHFEDYNAEVDKAVFAEMIKLYYTNIPKEQLPDAFDIVDKKFKGNVDAYISKMMEKSMIFDQEKMNKFLSKPKKKTWDKDLLVQLSNSIIAEYFAGANPELEAKREKGYRLFVDGLRKMNPDKNYYPNANSTMRLSYGVVGDYEPADAVHYDYYTTMEGLMEKKDNSNPEFEVASKLEQLYKDKDYGQYADEEGHMPVCFISNNDITGGNSGSPVINGKGELIGLAFDGNWEAMSGDIAFEQKLQRTISVDIRYVLFMVDKYGGAKHLIDELKLVRTPAPEVEEVSAE